MRRCAFMLAAVTLGLLAALLPPAGAYTMEPDFYTLSEDYVSPHIPWAKPYAGGKVRALFICPRGDAREVIEVAERLDLDYQVILTLSSDELGWTAKSGPYAPAEGISNDEMIREAAEKLARPYDVIVTGQIKWDMFPRELLYTIMEKVHDGTGLVVGYSDYGRNALVDRLFAKPVVAADFVTRGLPWSALPVLCKLDPAKAVQTRQFHDGRLVLLNYPGRPVFMFLTPLPPDTDKSYRELHYEYYQALVLKAMLWAGKKEPAVQFAEIGVGGETVDRAALPRTRLTARCLGPAEGLQAQVTVRDEDKRQFAQVTLGLAGNQLSLNLPTLPAGRYFADVVLRNGQRTVNWASTAFTVTSALSCTALTFDKPSAKPNEVVTATATLSSPAPPNLNLYLQVIDSVGREIVRKSVPVPAGSLSVRAPFQLQNALAESAEVTAFLVSGAPRTALDRDCLARISTTLYVPLKRSRGNYASCVWGAGGYENDFVRRLMLKQLHNCDVDVHTNGPTSVAGQTWLAQNNFDNIPYATRYSYEGSGPVREPCLTNPKFLEPHLAGLEKLGKELGPCGPRAYTLGDECFLARDGVDVCASPTCVADLQQWLRGQYPDIAALNASWGTSYKGFEEARPTTLQEAKEAGQPARWVDHRRHMEFVYARMMDRARQAIRKGDPEAEVGFDGPFDTSSYSGNDWWQLMNAFSMCNVYFHQPTQWEFLRSFAGDRPRTEGMLLGLWYGGYFEHRTEDEERLWPWRGIFNGFNSMWWYNVYHGNSGVCPMDAFTPSITVYPAFAWATEEMKELRSGEGQALMNATRLDDGIGVHYSQSSLHAATYSGDYGRLDGEWLQCFQTLEGMGLQYTCRAYAQIEKEGIDPARFPVFILPYSQAISPAEAAAFRKYVSDGGLLLADVRPGLFDQHGKPQTPGLLDDLFGIKRTPGTGLLRGTAAQVKDASLAAGRVFDLPALEVDGDVQVTDGKALGRAGNAPVVIVKPSGKGTAVLLNYSFGPPARARLEAAAASHFGLLQALFALGGVKPQVAVAADGDPLRLLETVRFEDGPIQYLGFLKNRINKEEAVTRAQVSTTAALHTYDVRTGRYLGRVASWEAEFTPARARLYARLPYAIEGLRLNVAKQASNVAGQTSGPVLACTVTIQASNRQPGRHWVELRVIGPEGKLCRPYHRNVMTTAGKASTVIPLALNDTPGNWKVIAREVISGKTSVETFGL